MTVLDIPVRRTLERLVDRSRDREAVQASIATRIVVVVGGLAAWVVLFAAVFSGLLEHRSQTVLYAKFREQLAAATAPVSGQISEGSPVALISVPAAGISNVVVVQGTGGDVLREGPGHRSDSPLPGQPGISVLYGKSASFGRPFQHLVSLSKGDPLSVTTGQGVFHFTVDDIRSAGDSQPPFVVGTSRLTLVTAAGSGWRSGFAPNRVVYVDASLHGKAAPATVPSARAVTAHEVAMGSDHSGLLGLVLWLELLLLGGVGLVIARSRWGSWQGWIVGVPIIVAALWGATQSAALLAPNLL
jgi:sortase A